MPHQELLFMAAPEALEVVEKVEHHLYQIPPHH
jgi:hypothetical protein